MNFADVKALLNALDTASICDTNKNMRVIDPAIQPIQHGLKIIGRAHTVRCHDDFLTVMMALRDANEGDILVIDTQNSRRAVVGELFSTEAARKKLAGIIVDGACRDVEKIRELPMPVYCRNAYPISGTVNQIFETQIPVECGGVTINPGDIIFGDDDGLIVVTAAELASALPLAKEIQRKESHILKHMEQSESLFSMLNFDEHVDAVQKNRRSSLKFLVE
ncbi:MAG: RraA family protein [Deferribacteres bacterium]|nr:RraA family protein [candidate division KSB1 bacterium]MCB9512040.1 RraA family protein [Deferribacteres bacterium]